MKKIETEITDPTAENSYIRDQAKNYLLYGTMPNNKYARQLAYQIRKGQNDMVENKILPQMPSEAWSRNHGDRSEPLDWTGAPPQSKWGPN